MTDPSPKRILNSALYAAFAPATPAAQFAVTRANAGTGLLPNHQYDYLAQTPQAHPLYDATVTDPALTDGQPLTGAIHASFTNGAATGTEGSGPGADVTFTVASGPTQSPQSIIARAVITREAYDSLSAPRTADEVANLMRSAFLDVVEGRVATALAAATLTEIELTAAAADAVLEGDLLTASAALDVLRGGPDMTVSVAGPSLFTDMVEAKDSGGRRLGRYTAGQGVAFAGRLWSPSWALTAASGATGYVFAPGSIVTRVSVPVVREVQIAVETVDVWLQGYSVTSAVRPTEARRIVFGA